MTELWIPQPEKHPDITNVYDMMMVFQDELDKKENRKAQYNFAMFAVESLKIALDRLDMEERDVTVATRLALINSTEDEHTVIVARDIGMQGSVQTVDCVELEEYVPLSLSLGMDVMSVFPLYSPDDGDYLFSTARTPISKVDYIRTSAA